MPQGRRPVPRDLGELELAVMQAVWAAGDATVQDVVDALAPARTPAYTTVMTVMSRLAAKRLLSRRKVGRAFVYSPVTSHESVARSTFARFVGRLYGGSTADAIAHLIETDPAVDEKELVRLEALIQRKRRGDA